jgi:hypothetical protein
LFSGVIAREVSTGGVTVTVAEPRIDPTVALTIAVPGATAVASPALFTFKIEFGDVQVAVLVRSWVEKSL